MTKFRKTLKKVTKGVAVGYILIGGIVLTQLAAKAISDATIKVAERILEAE